MPKIKTSISASSDEFKANTAAMQALVADLAHKRLESGSGGPDKLRSGTPRAASCCRAIAFCG